MNCVFQDPDYRQLKEKLIASTGLAYYGDQDEPLTELIARRLSDLGLPNCASYSDFLADEKGGVEMEIIISQLTIGETSFFRDGAQFAAIRDVILPDLLARNKSSKQLRIWSAGCATGAEPYSIAILLARDFADRIEGWQVEIYATDLNQRFLTRAAEGKFREWALRSVPDEVRRECFSKEGQLWTIHPRYKERISFHQMNLVESEFSTPLPAGISFDLILCRNVMIYFAPDVSRRLIGQFHNVLECGGWLVVGSSDHNVKYYEAFCAVETTGAKIYQKAASARMRIAASVEEPPPSPAPMPRPPLIAHEPQGSMEGLRGLANRGEWQAAAEYACRLLSQDRLNPEIHFYQALILENQGIANESERSLRQAIYLDRSFALAHYHLGLVLKQDRNSRAAAKSFENVLKVLEGAPDNSIVTAGPGVTVIALKEFTRMHLETLAGAQL